MSPLIILEDFDWTIRFLDIAIFNLKNIEFSNKIGVS